MEACIFINIVSSILIFLSISKYISFTSVTARSMFTGIYCCRHVLHNSTLPGSSLAWEEIYLPFEQSVSLFSHPLHFQKVCLMHFENPSPFTKIQIYYTVTYKSSNNNCDANKWSLLDKPRKASEASSSRSYDFC